MDVEDYGENGNLVPPMSPTRIPGGVVMSPPRSVSGSSPMSVGSPAKLKSPSQFRSPAIPRVDRALEDEGPRLVIRKLVLINYKSYAGRQEVGPFNDNFTAVVGPNGSGKSNVIDSLLFVFGFRAKKMRQDKLTGLIHNSEQQPNLDFARVEVHFETLNEDDSKLVLAREVRKDGTSFYMLNNSRCTYSEVARLLEKRGIDLRHKRFLILQGEVESIALMPPKAENDGDDGLLEYLEDIIGTSTYKVRIEELSEESEVLKQDCGEKQRRVDLISKDLKKLDADRANVEAYMLNKNRSAVAKSQLYQLQRHEARQSLDMIEKELIDQQELLEKAQKDLVSKREELAEFETNIKANDRQTQELKQQRKEATARLKEIQLVQVKAQQKREQFKSRARKAERNLAHAKHEAKDAQIWLDNFTNDNNQLKQKLNKVTASEADERVILDDIQRELHDKTIDLHEELQTLQQEAEPWRSNIAAIDHELKTIESKETEAQTKIDDSVKTKASYKSQQEKLAIEGSQAQKGYKKLEKEFEKLEQEQKSIVPEISKLETEKQQLQQKLEQLRPEVSAAQEARSSTQTRNRMEQALKEMKIPGLYGRLGSLGSIDSKYDVAVSTAAPELNNFVVDTVETAKRCVSILRERSIGRAKFMVLNKLRQYNDSKRPDSFPAPRLLDLIKPKDTILMKAFASVLGDTLVVNTPEEANKVAFSGNRRFKVVTLGGVLVKSSGQMSGGGSPSRGLMNNVEVAVGVEELNSMEKQLASLEMEFVDIKNRLSNLETTREELEIQVPRARIELDKQRMSVAELESQFRASREAKHRADTEIEAATQAQKQLLQSTAARKSELLQERQVMEDRSRSVEQAIQELQERILSAGGLRLREQSAKVNDLQSEAQDIQRKIDDDQEKLGQQISRLKKFNGEIEKYEKELDECAEGDRSTVPEDENALQLEIKIEELAARLQGYTSEVENAKQQVTSLRSEIETLRGREIEAKNETERYTKRKQEKLKRIRDIEHNLHGIQLYDESIARKLDAADDSVRKEADNSMEVDNETNNEASHEEPESEDIEMGEADRHHHKHHAVSKHRHSVIPLLNELSPDELESLNEQDLVTTIQHHEKACEGKSFDKDAIDRYQSRFREYSERKKVSDEAIAIYEQVKSEHDKMKKRRYKEFMSGFYQISAKLKEMYQLITMGGNAELELVDSMDPFSEGILFSVMPPKKSWRNIANLSGGEKTLSSLALVFALHHFKPTPLYVMDEIDAALDFRNVSIIANYIKERTRNGQFIVISLRNNMFELASRLVGVYKTENMTKSVTFQIN